MDQRKKGDIDQRLMVHFMGSYLFVPELPPLVSTGLRKLTWGRFIPAIDALSVWN